MKVLFVCRGNNGRSQMAEVMFNRLSRKNKAESGGVEVEIEGNQSKSIDPMNIKVMEEIGYDISGCSRRQLTHAMTEKADIVVTMVEKNQMPEYLRDLKKVVYWDVPNPRNESLELHKMTRDKIRKLVEGLVEEIG